MPHSAAYRSTPSCPDSSAVMKGFCRQQELMPPVEEAR